jgi:microcystin-dependent protein
MAKTLFTRGTRVTAQYLNSFREIVFDGADLDGHYPPLTDESLSPEPGNILNDFRSFTGALAATITNGLGISVAAGKVTLQNGQLVSFPTTQLNVANNSTQFVFVSALGQLEVQPTPPGTGILIAKVVTSGGAISLLEDLRPRFNYGVGVITAPAVVAANPIPSGSIMAFGGVNLPVGWLWCDGSLVDKTTYAALFAAIGNSNGAGTQTSFRLPNATNRALIGTSNTGSIGATGGSESITLSVGNLPSHNHHVSDPGHNHPVLDNGHGHAVNDPGHRHGLLIASFNSNDEIDSLTRSSTGVGGEIEGPEVQATSNGDGTPLVSLATSNVSVQGSTTGIALQTVATGVTLAATGNSDPISVMQPFVTVNYIIKI